MKERPVPQSTAFQIGVRHVRTKVYALDLHRTGGSCYTRIGRPKKRLKVIKICCGGTCIDFTMRTEVTSSRSSHYEP
jgi:hypothetical protein